MKNKFRKKSTILFKNLIMLSKFSIFPKPTGKRQLQSDIYVEPSE